MAVKALMAKMAPLEPLDPKDRQDYRESLENQAPLDRSVFLDLMEQWECLVQWDWLD